MFQDILNKIKKIKYKFKQQGYTLIEVIIAISFMGIIVASITLPLTESINLTSNNQNITEANNLAKLYIKSLQNYWNTQDAYDNKPPLDITSVHTADGKYNVTLYSVENIKEGKDGKGDDIVLVKRARIKYQDQAGNILTDLYFDFNRPSISN